MGSGAGIRQVGYFDCAGGGQVVVENDIAYVAHMRSPHGTSVIDVSDPKNPKELATIGMTQGTHSHTVRPDAAPGPVISAPAQPGAPRLVPRWETVGGGVPRFDFDGRYAYMSPTL